MKRLVLAVSIVLGQASLAGCDSASRQSAPAENDEQRAEYAMRLAHVIRSEELIRSFLVSDAYQGMLRQTLLAEPALTDLEAEYPGVIDHMLGQSATLLADSMIDNLPSLWQDLADIFYENLGSADILALIEFLDSPLGQTMLERGMQNIDLDMISGSVTDGGDVTTDQMFALSNDAAQASVATLTPDERRRLEAFALSEPGSRLREVAPLIVAAETRWANEPTPELDTALETAYIDAIREYTGR